MTIGQFKRLREHTTGGWVIHANSADGDSRTLCGYAYEGSCFDGEGDSGVHEVARGKINCIDCLRIIWHCEYIPRRFLAKLDGGKMAHVDRNAPLA